MKNFTITDEEWKKVTNWKEKHLEENHQNLLKAGGAIGGRFSYEFTPTAVGIIGVCNCCCGESFIFSEI